MRNIFLSFVLCSFAVFSFGQSPTLTDVHGKVQFSGFSFGGTSDVVGDVTSWNDQTNQYFANNIQIGDVFWDNNGNRWEVAAINSSTLFNANVDLRDINSSGGIPAGIGYVSRETPNIGLSLLVPDNNIGISQQLKSRVESHNMLLIDLALNAQDCQTNVTQTAHGFSEGDILGQTIGNGDYFIASTSNPDSLPVAFVCEVVDANTFKVSGEGWVYGSHPFTPGNDYFVQSTPGVYTTSADTNYHVFAFRAYVGSRYYDIPELIANIGGGGGGGGTDLNGIYTGSGTVPPSTVATLTNDFDIVSGSTNKMELDSNNIKFTSKGFFTVNTEGLIGLTHTGTSNFIKFQSLDERAIVQGEEAQLLGDTAIMLQVAGGAIELYIRDSLIQVGYLADDPSPTKLLGINANREIVETTSGGGGDNWGSQVVVSDATLTGNGTAGSPLGVANDLNGIISELPLGDVIINNPSDNDVQITQSNGNEFGWIFGGVNGPTIVTGNTTTGPLTNIDATQVFISDVDGNSTAYADGNVTMSNTNNVVNPNNLYLDPGNLTMRQANGTATGNFFPQIRLRQYGDGYPRFVFSSGDDANNDKDLFDTDPIGASAILGSLQFHGQNAAGDATEDAKNVYAAGINATSTETFSAIASGARLEFFTTVTGTTGIASSMILEDDGRLRLPLMPTQLVSAPEHDYQMDGSGYLVRTSPTHSGVFSGSTDAGGQVTITHGTGTDPDYAHMNIQSTTTPYFVTLVSTTTTQATFKVWDAVAGTAVTSTGITASWVVK